MTATEDFPYEDPPTDPKPCPYCGTMLDDHVEVATDTTHFASSTPATLASLHGSCRPFERPRSASCLRRPHGPSSRKPGATRLTGCNTRHRQPR
jgi:hypothetical protein